MRHLLKEDGFQTRPIVTGNIMRHPVSKFFPKIKESLPNADKIHYNGIFIGNYFSSPNSAISSFNSVIQGLLT